MTITIDNRIRVSKDEIEKLDSRALDELLASFTHENPTFKKWLSHRGGRKPDRWIKTWRKETDGSYSFPKGDSNRIDDRWSSSVAWRFRECYAPVEIPEYRGPEPWPFQVRLVESYLNAGPKIWRSPPGSGKSTTVCQLVSRLQKKTIVVAPTDAIFAQWVKYVREQLGIEPGIIKSRKIDLDPPVVVASQRSLHKIAPKIGRGIFGFVVFDEAQLLAAELYQETIDEFDAAHRLAVSGDEKRADGLEFLTYDQFGERVEEVDAGELIRSGTLVDVKVRVVLTDFRADWYLRPDPLPRNPKDRPRAIMRHRFLNYGPLVREMVRDEVRNEIAVRAAVSCIEEGEQVLVFSHEREHCRRFESALESLGHKTARLMGGDSNFEHQRDTFARGEARAAVGTFGKVGVGFESHKRLARGVIATPVVASKKSRMQTKQFAGRIARAAPGKSNAVLYYLHDVRVFGDEPVRLLSKWFSKVSVGDFDDGFESAASWLKRRRTSREKSEPEDRESGESAGARGPKAQRSFWED